MKLFKKRLRKCEAHINKNYDVDGLCSAFPRRIEALLAAGGDRLCN